MVFDVSRVRTAYPALTDGNAYLDGAAGTQVPSPVIDAIAGAYRAGLSNVHGAFAASGRADSIVSSARSAVADLVGGEPGGVIFGPSMTALTYRIAAVLSRRWAPGDSIVVSRLDHDANIRPWMQAADRAHVTVRWADVDPATGELGVSQYWNLVDSRTRLVAVTAASNLCGTRPDVPTIAEIARRAGALVYVDGVHATAHGPVSMADLGADFYATSAYKWGGPHVAAVVASPDLLEPLRPDKLVPSPADVPERFELGTLPFADLAGVTAAVNHLSSLTDCAGSRRSRLLASMGEAERYELSLFGRMLDGLAAMSHVTLYGKAARRTPTAFFTVAGHSPSSVASALADRGVNVWHGDNYAYELVRALGLSSSGGAVRAGLVHYNDASDVDRLLSAVADLALRLRKDLSRRLFLEEVRGERDVVVAFDALVAGPLVHGDRLGQRLVRVQPQHPVAESGRPALQVAQHPRAEAGPAPGAVHPHPLDLARPGADRPQAAAGHGGAVADRQDEDPVRRAEHGGVLRVEPGGIEAEPAAHLPEVPAQGGAGGRGLRVGLGQGHGRGPDQQVGLGQGGGQPGALPWRQRVDQ